MSTKSKKLKKLKQLTLQKPVETFVNSDEEMEEKSKDSGEDMPAAVDEQSETNAQNNSNDKKVDNGDESNGLAEQSVGDSDSDADLVLLKPKKKRKKGIIYVSNIPKHMNVTRIREILGDYGKIGRVYLQPEKLPGDADKTKKKKKRKPFARHFTEGWVEFESKRVAKQIVPLLNNKQISSRKKSQFFDYLWSMKYLPRFKWTHLTERMNYEQAVHKQRLMTEVSQARKETTFFQNNLDKSEHIKKTEKRHKAKEAKEKAKAESNA